MKWLIPALCLLFAFYLVGGNLRAAMGMVDDHEIARFLGNDGRLELREIPGTLLATEIGQWGRFLRYRPAYYSFRVLETLLWRDNASLWYAFRLVLLAASLILGCRILALWLPRPLACLYTAFLMTLPFWPDILTRLGPSEIYALPAFLLFIHGMAANNLWLSAAGYAVCIGSKENFLILFPILAGWFLYRRARGHRSAKESILAGILAGYTLFILLAILVATGKAGTDVYGTPIGYGRRMAEFVARIPTILRDANLLPALLVMAAGAGLILRKGATEGWRNAAHHPLAIHTLILALTLGVIASQFVYYDNRLPSGTRYDFPAMLLLPALNLMAMGTTVEMFRGHALGGIVRRAVYACVILLCAMEIHRQGYGRIRTAAAKNANRTRAFQSEIANAARVLTAHPEADVVFVSQSCSDTEYIVSVSRYLEAEGITNRFILHYTPGPDRGKALGQMLQQRLLDVMRGHAARHRLFKRFSSGEPRQPCFCITFRNAPGLPCGPTLATF